MGNLYLHLIRQEFPASGKMTAGTFYWSTLRQSITLLPNYIILLSHLLLPHLGFTNGMVQSSLER